MTEPQYETPTIREVVDIIDLLRPWMHGFNLVQLEPGLGLLFAVCDCGWRSSRESTNVAAITAYQRHVGYEE